MDSNWVGWLQNWGNWSNTAFFSWKSSSLRRPGSYLAPNTVHCRITSSPNADSFTSYTASVKAFPTTLSLGYLAITTSTGRSLDLLMHTESSTSSVGRTDVITAGCERLAGAVVGGWRLPCTEGGRVIKLWCVFGVWDVGLVAYCWQVLVVAVVFFPIPFCRRCKQVCKYGSDGSTILRTTNWYFFRWVQTTMQWNS